MKTKSLFTLIALLLIAVQPGSAQKAKLVSAEDSLSYALGAANYKYYVKDSISVNAKQFARGMTDASRGRCLMTDSIANDFITGYMQKLERAKMQKQYKTSIDASNRFLSENSKTEGVVSLPSGLQYKVLTKGSGITPGPNDVVVVHYKGTTIEGTKFDSSFDRGEPARFKVSNVIKGWVEGLQLMQVGSKYMLYVPSDLAYGERGIGNVIKPFETLVFEVELLDIIKEEKK